MGNIINKWYDVITQTRFTQEQYEEFMDDVKNEGLYLNDIANIIYSKFMSNKGVIVERDITTNN